MQRKHIVRISGVFVLLSATWATAFSQERPVPNELPPTWSLEEIAKATPPSGTEGRVYVLAWKVMEDDRPVRTETCLALRVLENNEGYCLAHLYLWRPVGKKPVWTLSMIHVAGEKGTKYYPGADILHAKRFKNRPSNKELYAAISSEEEVGWSFEQDKGWKFVSCAVCEKSWHEAIGEKPTRFFGR
jgi:hypothetical protein